MAPASGDGIAAIRHRLADTEVAQTCREPMRCLPIEADGKTAKRLRDREISRLQSQSSFQKRTCLRSREGQSRKQTMKITTFWRRYCLCHLYRPNPRLMCQQLKAGIERMSTLHRQLAVDSRDTGSKAVRSQLRPGASP